jgi:hypothetical protein
VADAPELRKLQSKKANFHYAYMQLSRNLWAAARSVALWNVLHKAAAKAKTLNREACFLDAAMSAAWTAAIVRCYALIDSHKNSLSLEKLLKLSGEIAPHTKNTFMTAGARQRIQQKLEATKPLCKHIKVLRHNEEAHISSFLVMPKISRTQPAARTQIVGFISECVQIFDEITLAAYDKHWSSPNFEKEIADDLNVFLTVYPQLRGAE